MLIFHIAERSRWEAAKLAGSYAQSTLGQTLEEVGFLHAAREDQWQAVLERHYSDVRAPLVLLVIDTDKLTSPWQEDPVVIDGVDDTFPHIHGPLNPGAVIEARPVARATSGRANQTFFQIFFGEMAYRMIAALIVMVLAVLVHAVLRNEAGDGAALGGALVTLVVGTLVAMRLHDRFVHS